MSENGESRINVEAIKPDNLNKEKGNTFPEIIANKALENTTLVYSVPVMGEWENGNMLRMLRSMFNQRTQDNQSFEVELVANIGRKIEDLLIRDKNFNYIKDENCNFTLKAEPEDKEEEETVNLLNEMNESVDYLKKIVHVQALARKIENKPKDEASRRQLEDLLVSVNDPLQSEIIQLAAKRHNAISLAVIDATHTVFEESDYFGRTLQSLRTLGADVARARYDGREKEVVLAFFDADTILEDNNTVKDLQNIFGKYPDLNYVFTGMTHFPSGHSTDFIADSPRENLKTTKYYNRSSIHGSPQILFKLKTYDKLQEISGWCKNGFWGDEDIDTAWRLIYHFGELQQGLLFESAFKDNLYLPTTMTADRIGGSCDSVSRENRFATNGVQSITSDIGPILDYKEHVMELINGKSLDDQKKIFDFLTKTRIHYEEKQKRQQRVNKLILNSFVDAIERDFIKKNEDGQIEINQEKIGKMLGGSALQSYIKANGEVISSVMSSPDDLQVIRYFLGRIPNLPDNIKTLTPFQMAIREYLGEVLPLSDVINNHYIYFKKTKEQNSGASAEWEIEDLRGVESKVSLMYPLIAENLALDYVYKTIFETKEFLDGKINQVGLPKNLWPKNRDEQELDLNFGSQEERLEKIKKELFKLGDIEDAGKSKFYSRIKLSSFPILELFRRLRKK